MNSELQQEIKQLADQCAEGTQEDLCASVILYTALGAIQDGTLEQFAGYVATYAEAQVLADSAKWN